MSIHDLQKLMDDPDQEIPRSFIFDTDKVSKDGQGHFLCFMCGGHIESRRWLVYWGGAMVNLLLHPKCAKELSLHLAKDGLLARQEERKLMGVEPKTTRRLRTFGDFKTPIDSDSAE